MGKMRRSLTNFGSNQKDKPITFEDLCNDYRHKLVEQLTLDQDSKNRYALSQLVNKLIPNKNFYCFKIDEEFDDDREEKEQLEIMRLVEDAVNHGGLVVDKKQLANQAVPILPIILDTQFRNQMLNSLETLISFCSEQMKKSIEVLEQESEGRPISKEVIEQQRKIKDIEQTFFSCIK